MSVIKPFRAVVYKEEKVKDFSKVICPPYDVISADEQDRLQKLSAYNFTHIDLGKDKPKDDAAHNKYTRAKEMFDSWIEKGVMAQDDQPAIYFYKQEYKVLGEKYTRTGFVAAMKLADESESKVFPHENTHRHAIDDRLTLTKSLDANLSPIFVCYSDIQKKVEKIFQYKISNQEPMIDMKDSEGVRHIMWRLTDPDLIKEVQNAVGDQPLFIADGHHRYKVACEYRDYRKSKKGKISGDESFNYVMTYFTNVDSKDLKIFPIHRILKRIPADVSFLEENFRMDKIKSVNDLVILLAKAGRNEHAFGLYRKGSIMLLRLKNRLLIDQYVKEGSSEYKSLDAAILKYFVLDPMGVKSEEIIYSKSFDEVKSMVDEDQAQAGFILNPVRIEQLKTIALNGEKMPPKTTYFYPKVFSGLTVYKME